MMNRIPMTQKGFEEAKQKLEHLKNVVRSTAEKRLGAAREMGDLSENSEYDAAREEVWRLDQQIGELEDRLARAEIVSAEGVNHDEVAFGARVKIKDVKTGEIEEFVFVGEGETDVRHNRIAITTPMGQALVGHRVGDKVHVQVPAGVLNYEILEIVYE